MNLEDFGYPLKKLKTSHTDLELGYTVIKKVRKLGSCMLNSSCIFDLSTPFGWYPIGILISTETANSGATPLWGVVPKWPQNQQSKSTALIFSSNTPFTHQMNKTLTKKQYFLVICRKLKTDARNGHERVAGEGSDHPKGWWFKATF